jgi:hypothetical protein
MSSSMEARPEPIHLSARDAGNGLVKVMRDNETIVEVTDSTNFVKDAIKELKLRGHDHETSVIVYGVSNNPAYNGAIKHHP